MRNVLLNLYTYDELSDEAKEMARIIGISKDHEFFINGHYYSSKNYESAEDQKYVLSLENENKVFARQINELSEKLKAVVQLNTGDLFIIEQGIRNSFADKMVDPWSEKEIVIFELWGKIKMEIQRRTAKLTEGK